MGALRFTNSLGRLVVTTASLASHRWKLNLASNSRLLTRVCSFGKARV